MNTQLDKDVQMALKILRKYEKDFFCKFGSKKRIYKMVGVNLEIKYTKANMLLKEALQKKNAKRQIRMIEMMYRAYDALEENIKANGFCELQPQIRCYDYDKGKYALVCDYDDEKANMIKNYNLDVDAVFFSMQELFRIIPTDLMQIKESLTKSFGDANFEKVNYDRQR